MAPTRRLSRPIPPIVRGSWRASPSRRTRSRRTQVRCRCLTPRFPPSVCASRPPTRRVPLREPAPAPPSPAYSPRLRHRPRSTTPRPRRQWPLALGQASADTCPRRPPARRRRVRSHRDPRARSRGDAPRSAVSYGPPPSPYLGDDPVAPGPPTRQPGPGVGPAPPSRSPPRRPAAVCLPACRARGTHPPQQVTPPKRPRSPLRLGCAILVLLLVLALAASDRTGLYRRPAGPARQ